MMVNRQPGVEARNPSMQPVSISPGRYCSCLIEPANPKGLLSSKRSRGSTPRRLPYPFPTFEPEGSEIVFLSRGFGAPHSHHLLGVVGIP